MLKASKTNHLDIKALNTFEALNTSTNVKDNKEQCANLCKQLSRREEQWWQARQRLISLEERRMFWFGDNSLIMWLLWQLVSYVVVAILLMLFGKLSDTSLLLWHYMAVFSVQTLLFIGMFACKGRLANYLQNSIDNADLTREQALNEMYILASDSILPDIHANAPISLQTIHERYNSQLRLASLQRLLQKEIDAGRLILSQYQIEAELLPPELADDELSPHAAEMIYKSLVHVS